jgi:hypothetical protein
MKKEFVPHEIALALAKLKFNEKCFGYYGIQNELKIEISSNLDTNLTRRDFYAAPTYSQAFRWFREKYGLWQIVMQNTDKDWTYDILPIIGIKDYKLFDVFDTYEEAELECLKELIKIVNKTHKQNV